MILPCMASPPTHQQSPYKQPRSQVFHTLSSGDMPYQQPTLTRVRIRSINDCNLVFYAVDRGILSRVARRLTVEERRAIRSGDVFVWEERAPTLDATVDGLERWTDSRRWGASRLTREFLVYHEKLPEVSDPAISAALHQNRLVKQTYSVFLETHAGRRKWHLVAYCSPETSERLLTVDNFLHIANLRESIPEGKFLPARCSKTRARPESDPEEFQPGGTLIEFNATPLQSPPGYSGGSLSSGPCTFAPIAAPTPLRQSFGFPSAELNLPKVPSLSRRDPDWVLDNCVPVSPDMCQAQSRGLLGQGASKDMAPLLYMRWSPYMPRHPADNDALRAFDTIP